MTVEVTPLGIACNINCKYCYQNPMRDAQNIRKLYDEDKIIAELDKVGQNFILFGGEALLVPKEDLEKFWKYGYEKYGRNGVQTNGILIDDDHIELFKKYNVSVGFSIDGPEELNDFRWAGTLEKTREATAKTIANIEKVAKAGIATGVIITLHRLNGTPEKIHKLLDFMAWIEELGVGGNIHTFEAENEYMEQAYALSEEQNIAAFLQIAEFLAERPNSRWVPFQDIPQILMMNEGDTTCFWHYCDPLNTQAVYGIDSDGSLSNCGRTNKEGINWYKADDTGFERYVSLYNTPQDKGGCKGCDYWLICGGSCPGEAKGQDWRNKTWHCNLMKALIGFYERRLLAMGIDVITKRGSLRLVERYILDSLVQGRRVSLSHAFNEVEKNNRMVFVPVLPDKDEVITIIEEEIEEEIKAEEEK